MGGKGAGVQEGAGAAAKQAAWPCYRPCYWHRRGTLGLPPRDAFGGLAGGLASPPIRPRFAPTAAAALGAPCFSRQDRFCSWVGAAHRRFDEELWFDDPITVTAPTHR